jgi:hypothetical protein
LRADLNFSSSETLAKKKTNYVETEIKDERKIFSFRRLGPFFSPKKKRAALPRAALRNAFKEKGLLQG